MREMMPKTYYERDPWKHMREVYRMMQSGEAGPLLRFVMLDVDTPEVNKLFREAAAKPGSIEEALQEAREQRLYEKRRHGVPALTAA